MKSRLQFLILSLIPILSWGQSYGWDSNLILPGLGRDDAVCFTLDEIVFVGTGNHGGFAESNLFYAYNTRTEEWEDVAPFPGVERQYARVETIGFEAFLFGGIDLFGTPLNDVWKYNLTTDNWVQLQNMPASPRWKTASFLIDGIIYFGTGTDLNTSYNDFWKFDPSAETWTQLANLPILPRNETISFALYDLGYIGLGIDCTGVLHDDIWKYQPATDTWQYETDFPGGDRWYAISEVLNGKAYVGTGENANGDMFNDFWEYDPSYKTWATAENLPNPKRRGVASCAIPFKGIYFAGGLDDAFNRLQEVSRYTIRNLNPPPLNVFYQYDNEHVYINDLPGYSIIRVVDLRGSLMFETFEQIDHLSLDVSSWANGMYIVWVGQVSSKFVVR